MSKALDVVFSLLPAVYYLTFSDGTLFTYRIPLLAGPGAHKLVFCTGIFKKSSMKDTCSTRHILITYP